MKKLLFIALLSIGFLPKASNAQYFNDNSDVVTYMENKTFHNPDNGMSVELQYLSSYNTYALVMTNRFGNKFNFINVEVATYSSFADLSAMRVDDGSTMQLRLYRGRLVVGAGEAEEVTFYLK
jgi:hypothetical protein